MFNMVRSFLKDESGATAIEYGLIAALVALAGIVAFNGLGDSVLDAFNDVAQELCEGTGGTYTAGTAGTDGSCG